MIAKTMKSWIGASLLALAVTVTLAAPAHAGDGNHGYRSSSGHDHIWRDDRRHVDRAIALRAGRHWHRRHRGHRHPATRHHGTRHGWPAQCHQPVHVFPRGAGGIVLLFRD